MIACPSNDVLLLIGEHIGDTKTKKSLTQCSRRFRQLFQPLLYSSLSFQPIGEGPSTARFVTFQKTKIALIQILCRRPDLARLVRHLDLTVQGNAEGHDPPVTDESHFLALYHLDLPLLKEIAKEIWETEQEQSRWLAHLKAGTTDAWSSLLVARLPHLQTINIVYRNSEIPYFLQRLLVKAVTRQRPFHSTLPFPRLRTVDLRTADERNWVEADWVLPFFYLPAVRTISGYGVCELWLEKPFDHSEITNPTCPVTEIKATGADFSMETWVTACDKLETMKYAYWYPIDPEAGFNPFHAKSLLRALLLACETLTTLWLTGSGVFADFYYNFDRKIEKNYSVFGSFKVFTVLRELRIEYASLIGTADLESDEYPQSSLRDLLPQSLEELDIVDIHRVQFPWLISDLIHLCRDKDTYVPHLKILKLGVFGEKEREEEGTQDSLGLLKGVCEEMRIRLVLHRKDCPPLDVLKECICLRKI